MDKEPITINGLEKLKEELVDLKENKNTSSLNITKNTLQVSFSNISSTKVGLLLLKYFSKNTQ